MQHVGMSVILTVMLRWVIQLPDNATDKFNIYGTITMHLFLTNVFFHTAGLDYVLKHPQMTEEFCGKSADMIG